MFPELVKWKLSILIVYARVCEISLSLCVCVCIGGGKGYSVPLSGSDFSNMDLRGEDYTKAVLRQVNFSGSDLRGENLIF